MSLDGYTSLFEGILSKMDSNDKCFLQKAFDFSRSAHKGQKRKSGEDYFIHPLATSISLWDQFQDLNLTAAGLLHDTVEDNPEIHISEIYDNFGNEVGFLVDAVTKNTKDFHLESMEFERKIDKFLYGGIKNVKCFLLKLADRADNIKTIQNLKDNKQVRMAFETQAIFTPLETLINFKDAQSIQEIEDFTLNEYNKNNIKNYSELKDYLINKTYRNFSNECFDAVYQNTSNVTWKINSRDVMDELLLIPNIEDKIEILSIGYGENSHFHFEFRFKKGEIMKDNIQLEAGDLYSFTKS